MKYYINGITYEGYIDKELVSAWRVFSQANGFDTMGVL